MAHLLQASRPTFECWETSVKHLGSDKERACNVGECGLPHELLHGQLSLKKQGEHPVLDQCLLYYRSTLVITIDQSIKAGNKKTSSCHHQHMIIINISVPLTEDIQQWERIEIEEKDGGRFWIVRGGKSTGKRGALCQQAR